MSLFLSNHFLQWKFGCFWKCIRYWSKPKMVRHDSNVMRLYCKFLHINVEAVSNTFVQFCVFPYSHCFCETEQHSAMAITYHLMRKQTHTKRVTRSTKRSFFVHHIYVQSGDNIYFYYIYTFYQNYWAMIVQGHPREENAAYGHDAEYLAEQS